MHSLIFLQPVKEYLVGGISHFIQSQVAHMNCFNLPDFAAWTEKYLETAVSKADDPGRALAGSIGAASFLFRAISWNVLPGWFHCPFWWFTANKGQMRKLHIETSAVWTPKPFRGLLSVSSLVLNETFLLILTNRDQLRGHGPRTLFTFTASPLNICADKRHHLQAAWKPGRDLGPAHSHTHLRHVPTPSSHFSPAWSCGLQFLTGLSCRNYIPHGNMEHTHLGMALIHCWRNVGGCQGVWGGYYGKNICGY